MFLTSLALCLTLQTPVEPSTSSPLYLFLGVDAGYARLQSDLSTEADKNGMHFHTKLLASYYWERVVLDLGAGWFYNRLFGSDGTFDRKDVATWAGLAEFAPRYRFDENWSFGPVADLYFGTDMSFASTKKGNSVALFAGPQIAYEFPLESWKGRILAAATTDVTVGDRQVYLGMLGFQLGFPIGGFVSSVTAPVKAPRAAEVTRVGDEVLYSRSWNFGFGSSQLDAAQRTQVLEIAKVLNAHKTDWKSLVVEGHADQVGAGDFNRRLSFERAEAVAAILREGGVAGTQIETVSFGSDRPVVRVEKTEEDRARNRRVVIRMQGARLNSSLEKDLTLIK